MKVTFEIFLLSTDATVAVGNVPLEMLKTMPVLAAPGTNDAAELLKV
mgnify:CR=1 FL=1